MFAVPSSRAAPLAVIGHGDYVAPLPGGHRFPMHKFSALQARLRDAPGERYSFHEPPAASRDELCRAHSADYVDAVLEERLDARAARRIGLPFTPALVRRSRRAVGGTLHAARLALQRGAACNTAGGSHHAHRAYGAGFCVFNDVAVAAHTLLCERHVRRILVVDLDVHQGDGTAEILGPQSDVGASVHTFSMHCESNYPALKRRSHLDVGLAPGTADQEYLAALDRYLPRLLREITPDLIFYVAGVDPHEEDRLGRLALTEAGIAARDAYVADACARSGGALCGVLGGGYAADPDDVARLHVHLFEAVSLAYAAREGAEQASDYQR